MILFTAQFIPPPKITVNRGLTVSGHQIMIKMWDNIAKSSLLTTQQHKIRLLCMITFILRKIFSNTSGSSQKGFKFIEKPLHSKALFLDYIFRRGVSSRQCVYTKLKKSRHWTQLRITAVLVLKT